MIFGVHDLELSAGVGKEEWIYMRRGFTCPACHSIESRLHLRDAREIIHVFYFEVRKACYNLNFIVREIIDYLPLAGTVRKVIDDLDFQIREVIDHLNLRGISQQAESYRRSQRQGL